jgi:hypothetical protein
MKRRNAALTRKATYVGPVMPVEMVTEIARHMRLETMSDIVAFRAICKSARDSLSLLLEYWAAKLVLTIGEAVLCGWSETRSDVKTLIVYLLNRSRVYYDRRDPGNQFIGTIYKELAKGVGMFREDYLLCLFNLQKLALFERKWLYDDDKRCVVDGLPASHCKKLVFSLRTPLSDVFHFDDEWEEVTAMKHFPNLRTVAMDVDRRRMKAHAMDLLSAQCGESEKVEDQLAIAGLRSIGESAANLRSVYYELRLKSEKPLMTHKPHKKSLICDAIVGGKHLFSGAKETEIIRDSLLLCTAKCSEEERKFIVLQQCLSQKRFTALFDRLGFPAGPESTSDTDSSDTNDSLSIVY